MRRRGGVANGAGGGSGGTPLAADAAAVAEKQRKQNEQLPSEKPKVLKFCLFVTGWSLVCILLLLGMLAPRLGLVSVSSCDPGKVDLCGDVPVGERMPLVPYGGDLSGQDQCKAWDSDAVVFVRIPKTGSTSLIKMIRKLGVRKKIPYKEYPEYDGAVPLVVSEKANGLTKKEATRRGFIVPNDEHATRQQLGLIRLRLFKEVASMTVFPSHGNSRSVYGGHIFHLDWKHAYDMAKPRSGPRLLLSELWKKAQFPTVNEWPLIHRFLKIGVPNDKIHVAQISMLRRPQDRLRSMYEYDRIGARNPTWRDELKKVRGDKSFNECLLDAECIRKNELQRWCSLQTEFLCGVDEMCSHPMTDAGLAKAKDNMERSLLLVGFLERMPETLALLEKLLPIYFKGITSIEVPYERKTHRDGTFDRPPLSAEAQTVLDTLCATDNTIYALAEKLFEQKLECFKI